MRIELPDDAVAKANQLAADGEDAAAVFVKALASLEAERREVAAVMEGVEAYERGDYEPLEDFDRRFREEHGIGPDA